MRKILYFVIFLFVISACKNEVELPQVDNFTVKGEILNAPENQYISLVRRTTNNTTVLDSCLIIDSKFDLSAQISNELEFYLLKFSDKDYFIYLLADSGKNITVNADFFALQNYTVENSETSRLIQLIENQHYSNSYKLIDLLKNKAPKSEIEKLKDEQRDISLAFVEQNLNSLAIVVALSQRFVDSGKPILPIEDYYELYKKAEQVLRKEYSASEYYLQFVKFIKNYEIDRNRNSKSSVECVEIIYGFLNFSAKTIAGDDFELNSLKGKWVLLNFWASWSASCVENNKLLGEFSANYPNINIVQISIDKRIEVAKDTLKKYNFNHILINDENGWKSEVINMYDVQNLPTNILINPQGEIVKKSSNLKDILAALQ